MMNDEWGLYDLTTWSADSLFDWLQVDIDIWARYFHITFNLPYRTSINPLTAGAE